MTGLLRSSLAALLLCGVFLCASAGDHDCPAYPSSKWSFGSANLKKEADARSQMLTLARGLASNGAGAPVEQSFIDERIFGRLRAEGIPSASLSTDSEFIRRVTIDLIGRIPESGRVRRFLQDQAADKRAALIDELLASPEFVDRWTVWFDDLLRNTSSYDSVSVAGRNGLHQFVHRSIEQGKPYSQLVSELLQAGGDGTDGPAGYILRSYNPTDPDQEFWDDLTANVTATFLGIQTLCVSCHDGARHLEPINTYLSRRTRSEFWQQSAFFSRMVVATPAYTIRDKADGGYTAEIVGYQGQRPPRTGGPYEPQYMFTGQQSGGGEYRRELARILTTDFQFARNFVNRIWAHFMVVGIVDPPDAFDPDNYSTQASDSQLLDSLAQDFIAHGYDIRQLMRRITASSAYQLSAAYSGEWKEQYSKLFARKLVRRLDAEEVHDSIVQATGAPELYRVNGLDQPVAWAMQLPDTNEPHDNAALSFMKSLGRGNRTYTPRDSATSILGSLSLANSGFVLSRISAGSSPNLVRALQQGSDDQIIEDLFIHTLSRFPKPEEVNAARRRAGQDRTRWVEDLQWALINKVEFILDY